MWEENKIECCEVVQVDADFKNFKEQLGVAEDRIESSKVKSVGTFSEGGSSARTRCFGSIDSRCKRPKGFPFSPRPPAGREGSR